MFSLSAIEENQDYLEEEGQKIMELLMQSELGQRYLDCMGRLMGSAEMTELTQSMLSEEVSEEYHRHLLGVLGQLLNQEPDNAEEKFISYLDSIIADDTYAAICGYYQAIKEQFQRFVTIEVFQEYAKIYTQMQESQEPVVKSALEKAKLLAERVSGDG